LESHRDYRITASLCAKSEHAPSHQERLLREADFKGWIAQAAICGCVESDQAFDQRFRGQSLTILGYVYRFLANFAFLAMVYFSLNFLTAYQQRAIVAFIVLVYTAMHVVSTLRQFNFFQKIERLEAEARTMAVATSPDGQVRKPIIREVARLRHEGELKSYIDLLFLGLVALLCVSKIVTN
jgi:hypothetical protein